MSRQLGFDLPESHLLPDVVVAFVDDELTPSATERAAEHLAHCPWCAAEVDTQRQVRSAVQDAGEPSMSAGFLASLQSIPHDTEVDATPDNLAVTEEGQLVAVQRPGKIAGLRGRGVGGTEPLGTNTPALGGSTPLGQSGNVLGGGSETGNGKRRAAQGAGVVVSGLVLSALALVSTTGTAGDQDRTRTGGGQPNTNVLRAQFGGGTATSGHPSSEASTSSPSGITTPASAGARTTSSVPAPRATGTAPAPQAADR